MVIGQTNLMHSKKVFTPVPGFRRDRVTGVQVFSKSIIILDSGFRRNDGKRAFWTSYESVKLGMSLPLQVLSPDPNS